VLGEQAVGSEGVVDPVPERVAQLGLGHAPVQGEGRHEHDVVHAGRRRHLEDLFDHHLADVGDSIGGRGSEMSSKQMVSFMPARSSDGSGAESP